MADCCPQKMGDHSVAKQPLFTVEVQGQDESTVQGESRQQVPDYEEPIEVDPPEECEDTEAPIKEDEPLTYVEDEYELDEDNEPVAYLSAIHKDEDQIV